jgi:hypothetical protein
MVPRLPRVSDTTHCLSKFGSTVDVMEAARNNNRTPINKKVRLNIFHRNDLGPGSTKKRSTVATKIIRAKKSGQSITSENGGRGKYRNPTSQSSKGCEKGSFGSQRPSKYKRDHD